jgi:hypothetical protein
MNFTVVYLLSLSMGAELTAEREGSQLEGRFALWRRGV